MAIILAIETSCDDTGCAIIQGDQLLSNVVFSQLSHRDHGGVIPELAAREHHKKIVVVMKEALSVANVTLNDLDAIAVTYGPGLLGPLLVGVQYAKGLALGLDIPIIAVNHMQAHVLSNLIDHPKPNFPFLCLTVSGGHTEIVLARSETDMIKLSKTRDDAAGEAFDKTGKMMGLPYPCGPQIDKLAKTGRPIFTFSTAKLDNEDFSFSGFKTSVRYFLRQNVSENPDFIEENLSDLCASVQDNIVNYLITQYEKIAVNYPGIPITMSGGVSANSGLREAFQELGKKLNRESYFPKLSYCTDNAGMIARVASALYRQKTFADMSLTPDPRLTIP